MVDHQILSGAIDDPEAVVVADGSGFYHLMVERDLGAVSVEGDVEAVRAMLAALPPAPAAAAPAAATG